MFLIISFWYYLSFILLLIFICLGTDHSLLGCWRILRGAFLEGGCSSFFTCSAGQILHTCSCSLRGLTMYLFNAPNLFLLFLLFYMGSLYSKSIGIFCGMYYIAIFCLLQWPKTLLLQLILVSLFVCYCRFVHSFLDYSFKFIFNIYLIHFPLFSETQQIPKSKHPETH